MAAGNTYTPVATTTLGSNTASYTFSSISSSYTDLVLIVQSGSTSSGDNLGFRVNGDSGTNYAFTELYGYTYSGTVYASQRMFNQTLGSLNRAFGMSTSVATSVIAHFMNYSNTNVHKPILARSGTPDGAYPGVDTIVNLWRSTSAINSITVLDFNGSGSLLSGTTLTLYGITAA